MEEENKELRKLVAHIKSEHKPSAVSVYLKEIVYGGTDGIVTTFAVVAGFAGAQSAAALPVYMVLLFGFANLFADGLSMGIGNFLSLRSEQDLYRQEREKEKYEIINNPEMERAETVAILKSRGFNDKQARHLTEIYSSNQKYWTEFMMKYELEMQNPLKENPWFTGLATLISFTTFGLIPLTPYLFLNPAANRFSVSILFTLIALITLGVVRWRLTSETILRSVGQVVFLGSIAAAVAYFVGTLFRV